MNRNQNQQRTDDTSSSELTHYQKYHGLLKRSPLKDLRDGLFRFFDYIGTMSSTHRYIIQVMNFFYFYQCFFVALYPYSQVLWPETSILGKIIQIFSALAFICPVNISPLAHFIVVIIVFAIILLNFAFLFVSLYIFTKMSKVPSFLISYITISFNIIPYTYNAIASFIGLELHYILAGHDVVESIVAIIFGLIFLIFEFAIQFILTAPSLSFKPQILHILYSVYGCAYSSCSVLQTFFSIFASCQTGLISIIFSFLPVLPLAGMFIITFNQAVWGSLKNMQYAKAVSCVAMALSIICPVMIIMEKEGNEILLIVSIAVIFILIYVFSMIQEKIIQKTMALLDELTSENGTELVENMKKSTMLNCLRFGFEYGHPLCHSWFLFNRAMTKYPDNYIIVLMFARYAAIYTEETTTLHLAYRKVKAIKHGNIEVKHILFQVTSLLQHRERGISKPLKKQLSKIQDKTEKCRGQMRYTWECVIRGNINELENLSTQLKKNEDEILREYNQLCLVYPNSPYVMSAYSAFLLDITCNEKEAEEAQKLYRLLRSGAKTRVDRSYFHAIRHIPTLPNDEQHAQMSTEDKPQTNDTQSVASIAQLGMINDISDHNAEIKAQKRHIESMVTSVKLPTSRYGPALLIFAIALLIPIISIPILVVTYNDFVRYQASIVIIRYSSLIPLFMSHVNFFCFQYVMSSIQAKDHTFDHNTGDLPGIKVDDEDGFPTLYQKYINIFKELDNIYPNPSTYPPLHYDAKSGDKHVLLEAIETLRTLMNNIDISMPEIAETGYFEEPLNYLFSNMFNIMNYFTSSSYANTSISIEHFVTHITSLAVQVATKDIDQVLEFPGYWTVIRNNELFIDACSVYISSLIKSFDKMLDGLAKRTATIVLSVGLIGLLVSIILVIFLFVRTEHEKRQLFKAFKALPKSAVSTIVQQLNAQSGKDNQTETSQISNQQEENALRVLSTSVDHGYGWLGRSWLFIILLLIFIICALVIVIFLIIIPKTFTSQLSMKYPLYYEIPRIHYQYMNGCTSLNRVTTIRYPKFNSSYIEDYPTLVKQVQDMLLTVQQYMHELRFGSETTKSKGISVVSSELVDLLANANQDVIDVVPEEDVQVIMLSSYDTCIVFFHKMFNSMVVEIDKVPEDPTKDEPQYTHYKVGGKKFGLITYWLLDTSYPQYVEPSIDALDNALNTQGNEIRTNYLMLPIIICDIVIVIIGIVMVPLFLRIGENAQWTLRLLLFCDPSIVLQNKAILKILSNDFSKGSGDDNEFEEKSNFYETVVSHLLDGVLFMTNDLNITSVNNALESILGRTKEELIGVNLRNIFQAPPGHEASLRAFIQSVDGAMDCLRSPSIESEVEILKNGEPLTLQLTLTAINGNGEVQIKPTNAEGLVLLSLVVKDMTSTITSRTLLQAENSKNENLLSMILPPIIVRQLQRGEQNICFTVQSASVVFMDIVSFTPWCGSNSASYVMSTLNRLFNEFDKILKNYEKMTKIKCIGDCYMCAGGIFDEVNQPAEHAKQAISFGIDAIHTIEILDVELKETLRIRVGCNTGGPIVAGVLGIEKPTFDILGPDINLAAMMEHHGVPMNVHIPQHVYELVYGDDFIFKERGDVDVKGKKYHTYIVSGYGTCAV